MGFCSLKGTEMELYEIKVFLTELNGFISNRNRFYPLQFRFYIKYLFYLLLKKSVSKFGFRSVETLFWSVETLFSL